MKQPRSPADLARAAQRRLLRKRRGPATRPRSTQRSETQRLGDQHEQRAARYLQQHGLRILASNVHTPFGEVDLIAASSHTLIFVEVRYRQHSHFGGAVASVNRSKQQRIRLCARFLLSSLCAQHFAGSLPTCRFDVIAVNPQQLLWIPNAFT